VSGRPLTIDAGVIVANLPADQGSLAIVRGAQIIVNGTSGEPGHHDQHERRRHVDGHDRLGLEPDARQPETGVWREAANEWGNLTIMGDAYISENAVVGNTPVPSPSNVANMEGLVNGPSTDQYGGGDDNDDSGSIRYLSLRYGGKVVGLANELNGLSLGGIGRNTDIDHVDIMNNVDDGIEIWAAPSTSRTSTSGTSATTASTWTRAGAARPSSACSSRATASTPPRARASATNCFETTAPRTPAGSPSRRPRSTTAR
jgi:hypothetical protein